MNRTLSNGSAVEHATQFGAYIRIRRQELQLTQSVLAARCGWTQERISILERGRYGVPSIRGFVTLAAGLEVNLADLIEAAGYPLYREP